MLLNSGLERSAKTLYKKQKGICPQCEIPFCLDDKWEIHHVIPKAQGGTDEQSNLRLLHAECHREIHSKDKNGGSLGARRDLEILLHGFDSHPSSLTFYESHKMIFA